VQSLTAESRKSGQHGATDVRSEIYSLGTTMYFLLTGVALSHETLRQPPKLSGFPKPLRNLLCRMLHPNPDQRPLLSIAGCSLPRSCLKLYHQQMDCTLLRGRPAVLPLRSFRRHFARFGFKDECVFHSVRLSVARRVERSSFPFSLAGYSSNAQPLSVSPIRGSERT
jgi:hypothetical protein